MQIPVILAQSNLSLFSIYSILFTFFILGSQLQ